jgi:hypothetical protein
MAKVTKKKIVFSASRGRPQKYPWDKWLDGRVWELSITDVGEFASFRSTAHKNANRKGLKIYTSIQDGKLFIQAYKGED